MTHNTYAVSDKVVLVTGGGSGIGRVISRAFLDNGALVAIVGRRQDALDETLAGYPDDRVLAVRADLSCPNQARPPTWCGWWSASWAVSTSSSTTPRPTPSRT